MALFLTSSTLDGLGDWLRTRADGDRVAIVPNASRKLADADAIVAPALQVLQRAGFAPAIVGVVAGDLGTLRSAHAILMTGGDPFLLMEDLRATGADHILREAAEFTPIAGQSAGAMVCGPTLEPAVATSPFTPPSAFDCAGLGLVECLALPHHDRPGRATLHRSAARRWAGSWPLEVLWDDEVLCREQGSWCIQRGPVRTRAATVEDAPSVADAYQAAARSAWGAFLGDELLARNPPDLERWTRRIRDGGPRFLVSEDPAGIVGFVRWGPATDDDLDPSVGELRLLYTHPRSWGRGTGRRLLERATWHLLCDGHREAVLWTEHRNERALAVYRENGWRPDGAVRERDCLGTPIREGRYDLDLATYGGGHPG